MGGNGAFWPKSRTLTVVGGTVTTELSRQKGYRFGYHGDSANGD